MTGAARLRGRPRLRRRGSAAALDRAFLVLGAVAIGLALATALRFFFVTRLGERIVADLRKALYAHILTLDPAYFLKTRTGEVLSRLTTDIAIVENLLGHLGLGGLRNLLIADRGAGAAGDRQPEA